MANRKPMVTALLAILATTLGAAPAPNPPATAPAPDDGWSPAVNGLQAKLVLKITHVSNGTPIIVPYLYLRNTSHLVGSLHLSWDAPQGTYRLVDAADKDVPRTGGPGAYSGPMGHKVDILLPVDGEMSFPISAGGAGIPADQGGLIDMGVGQTFVLKPDSPDCFLRATIDLPGKPQTNNDLSWEWHGKIVLPPAQVPRKPAAIDAAKLDATIQELGARMLRQPGGNESMEAVAQLSLINDPRVVPWYNKAMQTDNYELKFNALERLPGDDALIGLKLGMATQGKDIGNCTTAQVADQAATNIRLSAAYAVARSPLPGARDLLIQMTHDPDPGVRMTAMQGVVRTNPTAADPILQRMTQDPDERTRGEAQRLQKERAANK